MTNRTSILIWIQTVLTLLKEYFEASYEKVEDNKSMKKSEDNKSMQSVDWIVMYHMHGLKFSGLILNPGF